VIKTSGLIKPYKMFLSKILKMLTNAINLDGLFSYIIYSERYVSDTDDEVKYRFKTRTDGNDTCRSVSGCFEDKYIEPDMKYVIDTINKFENGEE
jgi:hypothetical protein